MKPDIIRALEIAIILKGKLEQLPIRKNGVFVPGDKLNLADLYIHSGQYETELTADLGDFDPKCLRAVEIVIASVKGFRITRNAKTIEPGELDTDDLLRSTGRYMINGKITFIDEPAAEIEKPPIGLMPEEVWKEIEQNNIEEEVWQLKVDRIRSLIAAIGRYNGNENIEKWLAELTGRVEFIFEDH